MLKYNGNPDSNEYTALVGKGVVFDAGGVNIKVGGGMADMHCDKGGACAVISAFKEALEMDIK
jgi:leucyl aminopeptidase